MSRSLRLIHYLLSATLIVLLARNFFFSEVRLPVLSGAFLHKIDGLFTDMKFRIGPQRRLSDKFVLIEVDNRTLSEFPEHGRWPWKRDPQAFLLYSILKMEPKAVLIDIIYSEKEQVQIPLELGEELRRIGRSDLAAAYSPEAKLLKIVTHYKSKLILTGGAGSLCGEGIRLLPCDAGATAGAAPLPVLEQPILNLPEYQQAAEHFGISASVPDLDGVLRVTYPRYFLDGRVVEANALALSRLSEGENREYANGPLQINFKTLGPDSVISAADLFWAEKDDDSGKKMRDELSRKIKDKFVVLGVTATSAGDYHSTPVGNLSGPEILASIADNAVKSEFLHAPGKIFSILFFIGTLLALFFLTKFARSRRAYTVPMLFFGFLFLLSASDLFIFSKGINVPGAWLYLLTVVEFAFLIYEKYRIEETQRDFIKAAFSRYVSPDYVNELIQHPEKLKPGGQKKELTVLFSDIRGFTSFSEKMDAQLLGQFLNEYLDDMTSIVFNSRGTLDKYIGDAVMAFWGDPLPEARHADFACRAAVQMIQKVREKQGYFKNKYGVELEVGIGLNTGHVTVGNLGSSQSLGYTVIGDEVNLTSRLEGATKIYGVEIIATEQCLEAVRSSGGEPPASRKIDKLIVKGKTKPIEIVQIFVSPPDKAEIEKFNRGRELYFGRKFAEAMELFSEIKGDSVSHVYIKRCEDFIRQAPPADWDGSWKLDAK